jgi:hypothetical protein
MPDVERGLGMSDSTDPTDLTDYFEDEDDSPGPDTLKGGHRAPLISEGDVYQQVCSDGFEFFFQGGDVAVVGQLEAC